MWKSWVGKTTLVKFLIRQFMPPRRTIFHGKDDISRYSRSEVQKYRRNIWVVFQDFKLIDWKNVEQNLYYPLSLTRMSETERKKSVDNMVEHLGLEKQRSHLSPSLSWGEKQRVSIWRALITNPEFIIADEPTWNLDRESSQQIADLLIKSNKEWNTIVVITHDQQLVDYVSQRHEVNVVTIE